MSRDWLLVAFTVTAIAFVTIWPDCWAVAQQAAPAREEAFVGKVLVVTLKSSDEFGATLEKVQIRNLGGKPYLVGTGVDDGQPDNWVAGQTMWFPLEDVAQMVEFSDVEQLKKAQAKAGL